MIDENKRLREENERLKSIIEEYKNREKDLAEAEKRAKERADEIISAAEKLFNSEADRLRLFKLAWDKVFAGKTADSEKIERLNALALKIDDVISGRGEYFALSVGEKTDEMRRLVGNDENLVRSDDIFIGDGDDGFSMDEILNPDKNQDLASVLKDLGIGE